MRTILLLLSTLINFVSCECPPKRPDGVKPPCKYVGPSVSASFQGVTVAFWGEGPPGSRPINVPESFMGIPINTK